MVSQSCVRGHLAQALVALHLVVLLALLDDVGEQLAGGLLLDRLARDARGAASLLGFGLCASALRRSLGIRLLLRRLRQRQRPWRHTRSRNGGSRNSLISVYFAIIWRNSGLEASVQSMQRVAPCESVKQIDQVWCSSSSTGSCDLELELVGQLGRVAACSAASFSRNLAFGLRGEVGAVGELGARQQLGQPLVADALVHLFDEAQVLVERAHEAGEVGALDAAGALAVAHDHAFGGALHHHLHKLAIVLDVLLEAALLDLVERRLRDVDVVALDQLRHVAEEEGEQQGADVRAVDVGVGHEDDFAVADLGGVEVVLADAAAQRGNHGADFLVAQHLVVAGLLHVQDLALERQDGLEAAVAALLGGAAGALALDQVEFAAVGIALGAVGQLAGQAAAVERAFAAGQVAGLAGRFAGARRFNGLVDDLLGDGRILLEEHCPGAR